MISRAGKPESALSLVELVAILAVILLIVLVASPYLAHRAKASARAQCVNNLKNVGMAFRIYSETIPAFAPTLMVMRGVPMSSIRVEEVFQVHSNELSEPKFFYCPSDKNRTIGADFRSLSAKNISYFASLTADEIKPQAFLAGDRNLEIDGVAIEGKHFTVTTNMALGWTKRMHEREGNLAFGDGSVFEMTSARFRQAVNEQDVETNYLAVP